MISVVMPAYNAEDFIAEAIESVLKSTYHNLELIIVDDGSQDNTAQIIHQWMEHDNRIQLLQQPNGGVSAALNAGIEQAISDWVAIVHADDMIAPERIERQLEMVSKYPEVVLWGTDGYHISSSGKALSRFRVGPTSIEECEELRQQGHVIQAIHSTILLKRDVFIKAGGYHSEFDVAEDVEMFDRMLEYGPLVTIPEPLAYYRIHGSSLTMQNYNQQQLVVKYVLVRQQHRLQGLPLPTFEMVIKRHNDLPLWKRLRDHRRNKVAFNYRRAGMAYGEGDILKALYWFGFSALIDPSYALKRAWHQWLRPRLLGEIMNGT